MAKEKYGTEAVCGKHAEDKLGPRYGKKEVPRYIWKEVILSSKIG